ncbi:MAG: hypothetical protein NTY81_01630 [Candidatus Staskawiczbacteria bacterium]|nr:hypothetical protein [Candidatus Staskawiczbacteria bacterium]
MNFFLKILRHKKIIFFIVFFIVISAIILPHLASAQGMSGEIDDMTMNAGDVNIGDIVGPAARAISNVAIAPLLTAIVWGITLTSISVFGTLSNLAGGLLLYIISLNADPTWAFTKFTNPVIAIGWTQVRDLANMVVVLGFVIIGIATALRIKTYQANQLLAKLIIAALLINFSLLICGIFIDGSNILTTHFLQSGGFLEKSVSQSITDQVTALYNNTHLFDISAIPDLIGAAISIIFFDVITLITFFLFFFLFLARYVFLWILVVLSPLAFVCYVFPFTKKFFDMWWNNFFQWCIIGVAGSFFLFLADKLTVGITSTTTNVAAQTTGTSMFSYLVPSVFLLGGLLFSMQSGAIGASMAVSAFKKTGKVGGGILQNSRVGQATGNLGNRLKSGSLQALESMGLAARGTTSNSNTAAVAKRQKYTANMTDNEVLADMRKSGVIGVAAFNEAQKRKIVNQYAGGDVNQIATRAARARSWGINTTDAEKQVTELSGHNDNSVRNVIRDQVTGTVNINPTTGVAWTQPEAQREAVRRRNAGLSVPNLRDMHHSQINENVAEDVDNRTFDRAALEFNKEQMDRYRGLVAPGGALITRQTALRAQYAAERAAGHNAQADHLLAQLNNLSANIGSIAAW